MFQGSTKSMAMVEDLLGRANAAMVAALNHGAETIYEKSQKEVPKSLAHHARPNRPNYPAEPLAERAEVVPASLDKLEAHVVYPGPYAAAQEMGKMEYERNQRPVDWEAENYTAAGTKAHYLEDAGKAVIGEMPEELAVQGHIAFGDIPGFKPTRQSMLSAGRKEETMMEPSGEVGQILRREQQQVQTIPPTSLREPPGGHPPTLQ